MGLQLKNLLLQHGNGRIFDGQFTSKIVCHGITLTGQHAATHYRRAAFARNHGAKNTAGNAAGVTAASKRTGSFAISIDLLRSIRMKRRPLAGGGLLAPSLELFSQMFVEESGDLLERILGFR